MWSGSPASSIAPAWPPMLPVSGITAPRGTSIISTSTTPPNIDVDIPSLRRSATFSPEVIAEIERAADEGLYKIRGFGTLRPLPSFDDLVLLGASISRYPLEGSRGHQAPDPPSRDPM